MRRIIESLTPRDRQIYWRWVGGMFGLYVVVMLTAAAIFISLLEAYASIWVSPSQAIIVSSIVLILTLLFRPTGLFGRMMIRKS